MTFEVARSVFSDLQLTTEAIRWGGRGDNNQNPTPIATRWKTQCLSSSKCSTQAYKISLAETMNS
jgi:hypothetical protein